MQNVGQPYGQGGVSSHQGATYGHAESSQPSGGSITRELRQFRKKDVDKQQLNDTGATVAESHVARVAPHNHYPPRAQDCYRYPSQFPDYSSSLSSQVKYSEISEHQPLQEQISPSVIQKAKGKEFMEMCNIPQPHMKPSYPEHINNQQSYVADPNIHPHAQYLQKDHQVHPSYKPESQYYPKENQYQQLPHQMQKYNVPPQIRKYPTENDFLSKLRRIHPTMARSIMTEHHLQESQSSYQPMDQNRMYPHQNQRYMNYPTSLQNNPYPHGYMPAQHYSNYPASCSYTRNPQMPPRFPSTNPHERSISPRRGYTDNLPMPPMNYTAIPQRISPNYPQYNTPEYAQHYQHRRGPVASQEYYPQHCRTAQYMPHQMAQQELTENRVTVSDSIKQYIENWADEETASEMNQIENNRLCKENLRVRDEQSTETVYMINASELQYLENGIPLVTSENGIPLVTSENGQYFLKSGVTIDNSTGVVRLVDKTNQVESTDGTTDRVVNLHIMDPSKPDCMLASKPNEINQRENENVFSTNDKPRVVIHQNTVIQPSQLNVPKETEMGVETQKCQMEVGTSLPILENPLEQLAETIFKECKKETVDKNCSPINMDQIDDFNDNTSIISPLKLLENPEDMQREEDASENDNANDYKLKNMPIIDLLPVVLQSTPEENKAEEDKPNHQDQVEESKVENRGAIEEDEKESKLNQEEFASDYEIAAEGNTLTSTTQCDKDKDAIKNSIPNHDKIKKDENEVIENNFENVRDESNKEIKVEKEEKLKEEVTKEIKREDAEPPSTPSENEEVSKNTIPKTKNEKSDTQDVASTIPNKKDEEKHVLKNCNVVEGGTSVIVSGQTTTKENYTKRIDDKIENLKNFEEEAVNSVPDLNLPEEEIDKPTIRRTKRIFSVDDIINNIGNNTNKSKPDALLAELRQNIQITKEFLSKEIDASFVYRQKPNETNESYDNCERKNEENGSTEIEAEISDASDQKVNPKEKIIAEENTQIIDAENAKITNKESDENINDNKMVTTEGTETDKEDVDITENIITKAAEDEKITIRESEMMDTTTKPVNEKQTTESGELDVYKQTTEEIALTDDEKPVIISEIGDRGIQEPNEENAVFLADPPKCKENNTVIEETVRNNEMKIKELPTVADESIINNTSNILEKQEVVVDKNDLRYTANSANTLHEVTSELNIKESTTDLVSQNEIQYRNAIRVDENNVLLEIAGELVEISVNIINGKKVITVVPLSESTIVDFNDNYETLDTTQINEHLKSNAVDGDHLEVSQVVSVSEVSPDADIIESTSEIIIGMDISLEEEIQLDLDTPQILCTKAAKKSYDNALQIPSITTSEDITDNSKANSYSPNDKVSSSKEQRPEKLKSEKKKVAKCTNSSKTSGSAKKKLTRSEPNKSVIKELMKVRKVKKESPRRNKEEEEEFVPFKDLIKARKLKKQKLQQTKVCENFSADSTNKLDQEEYSEPESEPKLEECEKPAKEEVTEMKSKDKGTKDKCDKTPEVVTVENTLDDATNRSEDPIDDDIKTKEIPKTKECQLEINVQKCTKLENEEKNKDGDVSNDIEPSTKVNNSGNKKDNHDFTEKVMKKVTFGSVDFKEPERCTEKLEFAAKNCKLQDPRMKHKSTSAIMVPSVSELLRENVLTNNKKKLSLAEYNSRKRKLAGTNDQKSDEAKIRRNNTITKSENKPVECGTSELKTSQKNVKDEPSSRLKMQRPKSLDDIKLFGKPKDSSVAKRKFSLEVTSSKPNYFDWEETQSPKTNSSTKEDSRKRLNEFRGLINNNKSKIVVDVRDLNARPTSLEGSEDEILQNYKEQVDSKLSSLNLQIPRGKPSTNIINPCSNAETATLMHRFLKNEKLSSDEMEKIRKIISYKRLMHQLEKIKSPSLSNSPLNPSYEIRKTCTEEEIKLHLKKVPEKKKRRFRNLYTETTSESDSDFSDRKVNGDYSVVQSKSYAEGVPKLIIKRKTDMPVPVVRLERLDLKVLVNRKRKIC